jgi:hypothetical protein
VTADQALEAEILKGAISALWNQAQKQHGIALAGTGHPDGYPGIDILTGSAALARRSAEQLASLATEMQRDLTKLEQT